jgi:hypothetical protein
VILRIWRIFLITNSSKISWICTRKSIFNLLMFTKQKIWQKPPKLPPPPPPKGSLPSLHKGYPIFFHTSNGKQFLHLRVTQFWHIEYHIIFFDTISQFGTSNTTQFCFVYSYPIWVVLWCHQKVSNWVGIKVAKGSLEGSCMKRWAYKEHEV